MTDDQVDNPFQLFASWYKEALKHDMNEPASVTLATATADGRPSARIVLIKDYDERGFCFYTNLTSRKGYELNENPHAALCFYWDEHQRQVRIEGKVERVAEQEADRYFANRHRGSQIGAWASKQSLPMEQEGDLAKRVKEITGQFEGQAIPRPPFWSGFRLIPERYEFWHQGEYRLHQRAAYTKHAGRWNLDRLYP